MRKILRVVKNYWVNDKGERITISPFTKGIDYWYCPFCDKKNEYVGNMKYQVCRHCNNGSSVRGEQHTICIAEPSFNEREVEEKIAKPNFLDE